MRSLRRHLLLFVTLGTVTLLALGGVILFFSVRSSVREGFDEGLQGRAQALAAHLRLEVLPAYRHRMATLGAAVHGGERTGDEAARQALVALASEALRVRFQLDTDAYPEYSAPDGSASFQIWTSDGRELARSGSLAELSLPRLAEADAPVRFRDVTLPGGGAGRAIALDVAHVPFADEAWNEAWARIRGGTPIAASSAVVVVARDRRDVDDLMAALLAGLLFSGLVLAAGAGALAYLASGRALRPLTALRRQVESLHAEALHERIRLDNLPSELTPAVAALNDALDRLERSFTRERELASRLAHELRTPIAELRAITDVARRWPDDPQLQARAVDQGHEIAAHMTRVVSVLLRLARAESGEIPLESAHLQLRTALQASWLRLEALASSREHTLEVRIDDAVHVDADPEVLDAVLGNVLQNAAEHAPRGSVIEASVARDNGTIQLVVSNPLGTSEGDAPDPEGLGLPLVRALTRAAGIGFRIATRDGRFHASIDLPRAS